MPEQIHLNADYSDFDKLIVWVKPLLQNEKLDGKAFSRMMITVEEMFTNIVRYAYPQGKGYVDVTFAVENKKIIMTFTDAGIPFDPTKAEKPDIKIPLDERKQGGLGIFISKLFIDKMRYKREDDKNILMITKKI